MFPHDHVSRPALARTGFIREPAAQRSALLGAWPGVRIDAVEVRELTHYEKPTASVEACVELAGLLPADVRVELIPPREVGGARVRRMWSICSYKNGIFRFATTLPAELVDGSAGWVVRVTPAEALRAGPEVRPVIRSFVPRVPRLDEANGEEPARIAE